MGKNEVWIGQDPTFYKIQKKNLEEDTAHTIILLSAYII